LPPYNAITEITLSSKRRSRTMVTINQTAESNDRFGAETGEKLFDDATVLAFITMFFLVAGLLE
jgi:hypothetical protein